jgi:hypothetical protein
MEWIRENWVFIVFAILFVAMHLFGFGCCGGHGRHREGEEEHKGHSGKDTSEKKGGPSCH